MAHTFYLNYWAHCVEQWGRLAYAADPCAKLYLHYFKPCMENTHTILLSVSIDFYFRASDCSNLMGRGFESENEIK